MNKLLKIFVLIIPAIFCGAAAYSQSDSGQDVELDYSSDGRGWTFGLNVGVYYPSKHTAAFYNGSSENVNNAEFVMSNKYQYQDIFNALVATDTVFVAGLPNNMRYSLAMQPGLYVQFSFNPTLALIIEFNYMRLKANDVITFEVDPIASVSTEPDYRLYPMRGVEERVYGDIGLKRTYPQNEKYSYFVTGGLNVNSTKVKQCSFYVEEIEYNMVNVYGDNNYIPNSNMQTYTVYQGGIGIGMFAGGGASLTFGNGIVIEPGITAHWLMVKLENYKNFNPGVGACVRFMF
jgi:hypothetical protein